MARYPSTKRLAPVAAASSRTSSRRKAFPERWIFDEPADAQAARALAKALNVTPAFARILVRRGFAEPGGAESFLSAKLDGLHDPMLLPDMPAAVARIAKAVKEKQRIAVFGDYDVDGVSSTALIAGFFKLLGVKVDALVPERDRGGYGLSAAALERIRACKPDLVITLDNGISAHEPVDALRAAGADCIIVDHHHVGPAGPPRALAVINPKRADSTYPFNELCGAGLAFKLAWAMAVDFSQSRKVSPEFRAFLMDALALAALGTLADVVPLQDENRILAAQGMKALQRTAAPGVNALLSVCQLRGQPALTARDVTFLLAPRINAAGRCGQAADALELLTTADPARAEALAAKLDELNRERQGIETDILEQARAQAQAAVSSPAAPQALVLGSPGWHPGVIGIVASRIVEEFHRPAVLWAIDREAGVARGSGRSIRGFHLAEAFGVGGDHLLSFGGHAAAAGLSARVEAMAAFQAVFEAEAARRLAPEDLRPSIRIEEELQLSEITGALCQDLERLEPCGMGNARPTLAARGVQIAGQAKPMGAQEQHLTFMARQGQAVLRTVGFGLGAHFNALCDMAGRGAFDIAFRPGLNTFRGETNVELRIEAFRPGSA
ncbi:MAG: single-stranded-DNA-specific exonuclease RecJ [Planctomycetes bacterium]|nr:single-stranded-DNA-specific exonuclease RecJ [Planctomycetota bacterium]